MPLDQHRKDNLANWNDRVPIHIAPGLYDVQGLVDDPEAISNIVEFDRKHIGDVRGQSLLHLQCHIGTETLSWAKLGASVTGSDFSAPALAHCRELAERLGIEARFVEAELYDTPKVLDEQFDIVYTSVGAINWLPDIKGWAEIAALFVRPGGRFYIRDAHPMLFTLEDERDDEQLVVGYPYFETTEPIVLDDDTTYGGPGRLTHSRTNEWNHGLGETINALIMAGLRIEEVRERRSLDWPALPSMSENHGRYQLPDHQRDLVPLEFSISATKE